MPDLRTWLKDLGLERYAEAFEREEIVFDVLPDLTEADLERLGLPLGPRRKLQRAIAARQARASLVWIFIVVAVVAAVVFGARYWIVSRDAERLAEAEAALNTATRTTQELDLARQRQKELLDRVKAAQLAEQNARVAGDQAKLKLLQEATRRAEAEAAKQAEIVRQRTAEAKAAEDARTAEAKKQADMARAAEKAAQEKAAAEQMAAEKAAAEKQAREKAALERAAAEKAAKLAAASPLEQFMARHSEARLLTREPVAGTLPYKQVVYVNDDSCPKGEIKELTGGNNQLRIDRMARCVKLSQ